MIRVIENVGNVPNIGSGVRFESQGGAKKSWWAVVEAHAEPIPSRPHHLADLLCATCSLNLIGAPGPEVERLI